MNVRFKGLWILLGVLGCSGKYGRTVPDDMVNKLTYENKIDLVEAENDLFVAYDKVDETDNEILRTRDQIRRAKRSESAAGDEIGQARDPGSKEVALLARDEAQARVTYLRARQDVNVKNKELEELNRQCAVARYQLARLTAVKKVKVPGSERYDPKDFEQSGEALRGRRRRPEEEQQARPGPPRQGPGRVGEEARRAGAEDVRRASQPLRGEALMAGGAWIALAFLLSAPDAGRLRQAVAVDEARLRDSPDDADALRRLGEAYLELG